MASDLPLSRAPTSPTAIAKSVGALEKLKVKSICLDGEVTCFTGAAQDFDKLWARKHDHEARLTTRFTDLALRLIFFAS
jgi:ATP-dependent DNA ligase